MSTLTNNTGIMRNTGGPGVFNPSGWQKIRKTIGQPTADSTAIERPQTRHGNNEHHSPGLGRPVTQGKSRRTIAPPVHLYGVRALANGGEGAEGTYVVGEPVKDGVMNRRTSSRRMNRIHGGGTSSTSIKYLDHYQPHQQQQYISNHHLAGSKNNPEPKCQQSNASLPTVKSLPPGYDPIFNPSSNSQFAAIDHSQIKIKPMRLSTGFDQHIEENMEPQRASPIDGSGHTTRTKALELGVEKESSASLTSPIYGSTAGETKSQRAVKPNINISSSSMEGKRKSLGKVIGSSHPQSGGHFRKKMAQKNTRETTAMESIIEEDETRDHQFGPRAIGPRAVDPRAANFVADDEATANLARQLTSSLNRGEPVGKKAGSNGSNSLSSKTFQMSKNEASNELSTMQTSSGGFSNTKRSPRDPSFESSTNKKQRGSGRGISTNNTALDQAAQSQLKLRPQLISSQTQGAVDHH